MRGRVVVEPKKVFKTGKGQALQGDPLVHLERELEQYKFIEVNGAPPFTGALPSLRSLHRSQMLTGKRPGGATGYVSYDCVHYFEPKTARELADPIGMPESVFLLSDTLVAFDHLFQHAKVVSHVFVPATTAPEDAPRVAAAAYADASARIAELVALLLSDAPLPLPEQPTIVRPPAAAVSNVGEQGYKQFVTSLKENIVKGDIIQAVPSQRLRRETALHPFNVYRYACPWDRCARSTAGCADALALPTDSHLRQLNPSPYMFYIDCGDDVRLVGASPECLCKVEKNVVTNHAIAGTVRRGKNAAGARSQGFLKSEGHS